MIRPTVPSDTDSLVALAQDTGFFKPIEVQALREVLDDYHSDNEAHGHRCVTLEEEGRIVGFAYYAPTEMTDRTWHLYWIAVAKDQQGRGAGGKLVRHVEDEIRKQRGRHLLIETGSIPLYDLTRRFYVKHGYTQVAVIPEYYAEGDSMVIFRKAFA